MTMYSHETTSWCSWPELSEQCTVAGCTWLLLRCFVSCRFCVGLFVFRIFGGGPLRAVGAARLEATDSFLPSVILVPEVKLTCPSPTVILWMMSRNRISKGNLEELPWYEK